MSDLQPQPPNPPSRYKGRCDVHGLRTCDECQFGETDAKLLAVAEARIVELEADNAALRERMATAEREVEEAQERLAMAVEALEEISNHLYNDQDEARAREMAREVIKATAPAVEAFVARVRSDGAAKLEGA